MSASHWDGVDRAPLRIGLALCAAVFTLLEARTIHEQHSDPRFVLTHAPLASHLPATPAALCAVCAVILLALLAFALHRRPLLSSTVALGGMAMVSQWGVEYFDAPSHNYMFPGGMLFGWLLGLVYARTLGPRGAWRTALSEELAEAGAMSVFAALYVGSATSKLLDSGFRWVNHDTVRVLLLSQRGVADLDWVHRYRALVIDHPGAAWLASLLTLVIEGGAFFLLVSRRMRTLWGALILLLHLNIIVLATMPYLESMFLALLFAFPWPALLKLERSEAPAAPDSPALSWPVLLGLLGLMLLAALLPVGWSPFGPRG